MAEDGSNPVTEVLSSGTLAPQVIEKLREELTCSICLDVLQDPRILPCYHSFCRLCLSSMRIQPGEVLKCPYCSRKFFLEGEVKNIPSDCRTKAFLQCIKASTHPDTSPLAADTEETGTDKTFNPHADIELGCTLCPMCQWTLTEPRQLTCGHSCCTRCLEKVMTLSPDIDCPTCGVKTDTSGGGISMLPIDGERLLEALSDESPLNEDAIHLNILNEESEDEFLPADMIPLLTHEEPPDTSSSSTLPSQPSPSILTPLREYRTTPELEKPLVCWEMGLLIILFPFALPGLLAFAILYGCFRLLLWICRRIANRAPEEHG